ncbi:hypothetical protein IL306_000179 [Fusarium sp. DS 682]|nr:hypothetical protein IL306_000179 [Fusarium sp. DS 682]
MSTPTASTSVLPDQASPSAVCANSLEQPLEPAITQQLEREAAVDDDSALSADADYADEYPNSFVIGTDLSAVQPDWVPPNLKFEIDDCTKPWTWDANTFDFVHMRYLFGAIKDWKALFKEAYNAVKPGGWVEPCESEPMTQSDDSTVTNDGTTALGGTWDNMFIKGGKTTGFSLPVLTEDLQMKAIKEAGFVDIQEAFYKWLADEYQVFLMQVRKDFRDKKLHPYFKVHFVWGRKPESEKK